MNPPALLGDSQRSQPPSHGGDSLRAAGAAALLCQTAVFPWRVTVWGNPKNKTREKKKNNMKSENAGGRKVSRPRDNTHTLLLIILSSLLPSSLFCAVAQGAEVERRVCSADKVVAAAHLPKRRTQQNQNRSLCNILLQPECKTVFSYYCTLVYTVNTVYTTAVQIVKILCFYLFYLFTSITQFIIISYQLHFYFYFLFNYVN